MGRKVDIMAKYSNSGTVDIDRATNSIITNGGGINKKEPDENGVTHVSVYSTTENRHLSYDRDSDGNYSGVHTDRDNRPYMNYKGGK